LLSLSQEARQQAGITDNLVRLSVGCEDTVDLLEDLGMALDALSSQAALSRISPGG